MPRYFFNTHIGEDIITDLNGEELRDPDHAWDASRSIIRAMMNDPKNQYRLLAASLVVTDEAGEVGDYFLGNPASVAADTCGVTTTHG